MPDELDLVDELLWTNDGFLPLFHCFVHELLQVDSLNDVREKLRRGRDGLHEDLKQFMHELVWKVKGAMCHITDDPARTECEQVMAIMWSQKMQILQRSGNLCN